MKRLIFIAVLISAAAATAAKKDTGLELRQKAQLDSLQKELDVLRRMRSEKLDRLEQAETRRWEARYRQNRATQDHQDQVRSLESKYSRMTGDLSRLNDELVQVRNTTADLQEKSKAAQNDLQSLVTQVQILVDKASTDLSADYPVGLEQRAAGISRAQNLLSSKSPQAQKAITELFTVLHARLSLTHTAEFTARTGQMNDRADIPLYRLRLGTVYLAEAARDGNAIQVLQRTGALQGRVFEWRHDLSEIFAADNRKAIQAAARGDSTTWIPLDILQNKAAQNTTRSQQEQDLRQRAIAFFKAGGVVMYPLIFVALLALLLSLERWALYLWRGRISAAFLNQIFKLVEEKRFQDAYELCVKTNTSLAKAIQAVLRQVPQCSRTGAEKALKEAMLREIPLLERRLGLIGALGSSAPLLGLLGTVTGMITLFQVITDVGTNDARVLAGGIAEALITTQTGLVIAIPVLLMHGWLTERLDHITASIALQSMSVLNRLWPEADQH